MPNVDFLRVYLPRYYLIRFPILLAAFLILIVPLGLVWAPSMLGSVFVLGGNGLTAVSLFATWAAFTVMATRRVTLMYGPARFGGLWTPWGVRVHVRTLLGHVAVALPLIGAAVARSATEGMLGWGAALLHAGAGMLGAAAFVWMATLLQAVFVRADVELPDIVVPQQRAIEAAHRAYAPQLHASWLRRLQARLAPYLGPGYFTPAGDLLPGHGFAAALFAVYALIYAAGYAAWHPGTAIGAETPALVFILIHLTLWTWLLAGLAFFLDRHRVPVLLPIVLASLALWTISRSDHYFDLETPRGEWALAEGPVEIAAKRRHPLLTVVAVDGGGIQAAAWSARVLTGIQERWPDFHRSVRLISAVSGGSLGTMYFVGALKPDGGPDGPALERVRALALRGSLNEAAWGLAYPDLWRALLPIPQQFRFEKDRGWAMQQAWERGWMEQPPQLSEWVRGVHEGWRPAIALNAVGVESGSRFAFSTFAPPYSWGIHTVDTMYPGRDVSVSTAVRLSATFPYVTPIARARPEAGGTDPTHFADGGYYDNTGMGLAMRWLDRALGGDAAAYRGRVVAFIRIRSAPAASSTPTRDRGWQYQVVGPIQTLLAVRVAGQSERANTELEFLQRLWCSAGVEIRSFEFAFEQKNPPLSWQLTPRERQAIEREWLDTQAADRSQRNQAMLRALVETGAGSGNGSCAPR